MLTHAEAMSLVARLRVLEAEAGEEEGPLMESWECAKGKAASTLLDLAEAWAPVMQAAQEWGSFYGALRKRGEELAAAKLLRALSKLQPDDVSSLRQPTPPVYDEVYRDALKEAAHG